MTAFAANNFSKELLEQLARPSIGSRILSSGLNILGTAGRVLDTPASALRGIVHGDIDRALGGILDSSKRVSGEELFGGAGNKFTWRGLGAEILLDPINLISFGTLGTAGRLASRVGKLQNTRKVKEGFGFLDDAQRISSTLDDVLAQQAKLGRTPGETLKATLSEQAQAGQRGLINFDIPFGPKYPLVAGAPVLEGMSKIGAGFKTTPVIGKGLESLNKALNPNMGLTDIEKEIRQEVRRQARRIEAEGAQLYKSINTDLLELAKRNNLSKSKAERILADAIELGGIKHKFEHIPASSPKAADLLKLRLRGEERTGILPNDFLDLAIKVRQIYDDLLKSGQNAGFNLTGLTGELDYLQRMISKEAFSKLHDKSGLQNKIHKYLTGFIANKDPGFAKRRVLSRDIPITELNKALRNKFKLDFDYFSTDITANLAFRQMYQRRQELYNTLPGNLLKILGKEKATGLVNAASLLKEGTPQFKTITKVSRKYNTKIILNDLGEPILVSTEKGRDKAAKLLKQFHKLGYNQRQIQLITNRLYHGTSTKNIDEVVFLKEILEGYRPDLLIGQAGLQPKKQNPRWSSTQLVNEDPVVFGTPNYDSAGSYAQDAIDRFIGGQEDHSKTFRNFLEEYFLRKGSLPRYEADFLVDEFMYKSNKPTVLNYKLSDLIQFDLAHPAVDILADQALNNPNIKFGTFQKSVLPPHQQAKLANKVDDISHESQIPADKIIPPELLKIERERWEKLKVHSQIQLAKLPPKAVEKIARWEPNASIKNIRKALKDIGFTKQFITESEYANAEKLLTFIKEPNELKKFTTMVDKVNAYYRGFLTSLFPAYHIRNGISGMFMNTLAGMANPKYYKESIQDLLKMDKAEGVKLKTLGVLGKGQHEETMRLIMAAGIDDNDKLMGLFNKGRLVGQRVDDVNRYALFKMNKAKGLSDEEAAEQVIKYHFDYDDITHFEKKVMRRAVLFYTFTRKNIPLMFQSMLENPRYMQAYARATGNLNANIVQPSWIIDAFFLGEDSEGNSRRLSLGLPPEDLNRYSSSEGRTIQRFFQQLFAQANPLLTAGYELMSGQSLHFGSPVTGPLHQRLLDVSPLARFTGVAQRGVKDPLRELARTGLALNIRDVPPDQADRNLMASLRHKLEHLSKQGRARPTSIFTQMPGQEDPEVAQLLSALGHLQGNR